MPRADGGHRTPPGGAAKSRCRGERPGEREQERARTRPGRWECTSTRRSIPRWCRQVRCGTPRRQRPIARATDSWSAGRPHRVGVAWGHGWQPRVAGRMRCRDTTRASRGASGRSCCAGPGDGGAPWRVRRGCSGVRTQGLDRSSRRSPRCERREARGERRAASGERSRCSRSKTPAGVSVPGGPGGSAGPGRAEPRLFRRKLPGHVVAESIPAVGRIPVSASGATAATPDAGYSVILLRESLRIRTRLHPRRS